MSRTVTMTGNAKRGVSAEKTRVFRDENTSRGDWIRTSDLYVPNVALYQAEPRPDIGICAFSALHQFTLWNRCCKGMLRGVPSWSLASPRPLPDWNFGDFSPASRSPLSENHRLSASRDSSHRQSPWASFIVRRPNDQSPQTTWQLHCWPLIDCHRNGPRHCPCPDRDRVLGFAETRG